MQSIKHRRLRSVLVSGGLILVGCLSLIDFVQVAARQQNTPPASPEESALRSVVKSYVAAYGRKDLAGVVGLWSEKSPNLAAFKQSLPQRFKGEELRPGSSSVSRVKVENERASLRVAIERATISPQDLPRRDPQLILNFEFVKEDGKWKIWRSASAAEDLANALVKAGSQADRATLLTEERALVTAELSQALLDQGLIPYDQGKMDRAKEIFELALEMAQRCGDRGAAGLAFFHIGLVLDSKGDLTQAREFYTKCLQIAEEIGDLQMISRALTNLGISYKSQGNYAKALELYRKSLKISEQSGDQGGSGRTLANMGNVQLEQGNYAQALESYQQSLKIAEEAGSRSSVAGLLKNLGSIHMLQGNYAQALVLYRRSLKISEELGEKILIAHSLFSVGNIYRLQGNYAQALEQYQQSLKITREIGSKYGTASVLRAIGEIHKLQGNYPQALAQFQQSLKLKEEVGDQIAIAGSLNDLGTIRRLQGDFTPALEQFQKSLKIYEGQNDKVGVADTLNNIGDLRRLQGAYGPALEQYQQSLKLFEGLGDKTGIAKVLNNLGLAYEAQGNHPEAAQVTGRAAELASQIGNPEILGAAQAIQGRAYLALKQFDRARQSFQEAITTIETLQTQVVGGEQAQQRFFELNVSPYQAMIDLELEQKRLPEAFAYAQRLKARTLLELLQNGRVNIDKSASPVERDQEQRLSRRLVSLNRQISGERTKPQPDSNLLAGLNEELNKARLEFEAFQTTLYAAHPELKVQRGEMRPITLDDAGELIPNPRTAILDFIVTDRHVQLFVLTRDVSVPVELRTYTIDLNRESLSEKVERFRGRLANRDRDYQGLAQELYTLLLKPAEKQLQNKTVLIISPNNVLWDLPFQALQSPAGRYLIEDAAISYAPSLSVLREMQLARQNRTKTAPAPASILALGNPDLGNQSLAAAKFALMGEALGPLPEAAVQVTTLGKLYGSTHSKIYTGAAAREDVVKEQSSQYRILHLATHGILNDVSPMYSHVMLAPASGPREEDGLLEAWEMMNLNLNADLVVLSACETARGRVGAGEGVIGLTWALFVAGCPATVVSQWKVESSSTTALMVEFHKGFKTRFDPQAVKISSAESMRRASLKLMRTRQYRHPFYWGGFVVVGDGR